MTPCRPTSHSRPVETLQIQSDSAIAHESVRKQETGVPFARSHRFNMKTRKCRRRSAVTKFTQGPLRLKHDSTFKRRPARLSVGAINTDCVRKHHPSRLRRLMPTISGDTPFAVCVTAPNSHLHLSSPACVCDSRTFLIVLHSSKPAWLRNLSDKLPRSAQVQQCVGHKCNVLS